jgi:peptidoglycan/LPS O-acetylase OafA/YrhL
MFFVLSGDSLSVGYFGGKGASSVIDLGVKRYARLTIPIIATCAIIFILHRLGTINCPDAWRLVRKADLAAECSATSNSLAYYFRYALLGVYTRLTSTDMVDPLLWTMHFEIVGSITVFILLLFYSYLKQPILWTLLVACLLLAINDTSTIGCFLFGIIFSFARASGLFALVRSRPLSVTTSYLAIILIAGADALSNWTGIGRDKIPFFAVPLIFAIFCNRHICHFLAKRLSRTLGAISFPLYLVQYPIMLSFSASAIVLADRHGGLNYVSMFVIGLLSTIACLGAAFLFMPIISVAKFVANRIGRALVLNETSKAKPTRAAAGSGGV